MKVTAVAKYSRPRFPTHEILEQHPEFLRIVPQRWKSNPVVLTALAGACLLLNSCRAVGAGSTSPKVAPVFQHGVGVLGEPPAPKIVTPLPLGRTAGVPLPPQCLLTEAEARQIISDEARKAGLHFTAEKTPIKGVQVPLIERVDYLVPRDKNGRILLAKRGAVKSVKADVLLDGTDKKRKVSYEYVSGSDYGAWLSKKHTAVVRKDILGSAVLFREGLTKARGKGYCGVFYDPVGRGFSNPVSGSEAELRAQVKDFIKWLKGQGVI